jgi:Uma2 family endonuclease
MSILLPIDAPTVPITLVLDPPLSDEAFLAFCQLNDVAHIERTREGVIVMNPPAGILTSSGNTEILAQLHAWWKTHRQGRVTDSNGGFNLPDGSMLSPDAAYISPARLAQVPPEELEGFPHLCPDFVIELRSRRDTLPAATQKMERWIENGAALAWLIDPYERRAHIYQPTTSHITDPISTLEGSGPVTGFTLDLAQVWHCYDR